jgi:very-short-patch-repair endonuclease
MYRDNDQRNFARTLRNQSTSPEKRLWHFLRAQKLRGYKFRRQSAIGSYIVDFVCFSAKLIVELDGPQNLQPDSVEHDQRRDNWLAARGFHLIRFRNQELDENIHAVVDAIERVLAELATRAGNSPLPQPSPPRGGNPTTVDEVGGILNKGVGTREERAESVNISGPLPVPGRVREGHRQQIQSGG